ncbi:MAG TPA: hypothetical protein PLV57_20505 [Phycisphaerae bacterium]|nr:hypothetical protein [Phycisphaerae bacterium]
MGELKKVQSGSPLVIPAQTFNAFIDAARDYQDRQLGQQRTALSSSNDSGMVLLKNISGADRARFEILGINTPLIQPADNLDQFVNRPALSGVTPTAANHWGKFGVLAEPIRNGALGWAWVSGVCPVKIDIANANHWHADIADGSAAYLKSSGGGAARILWKDSGTGVRWAVVRLGRWSPTVFPVNLTQTGGSQGTSTTAASWTYSVVDPVTNQTLATGVNPTASPHKWKRPSAGWMIAATFGYAHYNAQGQLVLGWINEMVEQEACTS